MGELKMQKRIEEVEGFLINRPRSLEEFPYEYLLLGDDGEDYCLESTQISELEEFIDKKVSVVGEVFDLHRGFKLIKVKGFGSRNSTINFGEENIEDMDFDEEWYDFVV